jgi:crotonobetainyl-CoA:carnitine CoA-transferase CaiB-like acyl-CoA transferase
LPGWSLSVDSHYQICNRFAWAWKIASLGVPVVLIAAIFATETADIWRSRFVGKHCCCSIVASVGDAFVDPHYITRGMFRHVLSNPEGSTMPALPVPLDPGFRRAPVAPIASPALGADNKKYLA